MTDNAIKEALLNQMNRLRNGEIISRRGIDHLFSKGFPTVRYSAFKDYMKRNGIILD